MIQDPETMRRQSAQLKEVYLVFLGLSREQSVFKQSIGKLAKDTKALADSLNNEADKTELYHARANSDNETREDIS